MLSLMMEFYRFAVSRKKLILIPILFILILFGALLFFTQGTVLAPFIYTLF